MLRVRRTSVAVAAVLCALRNINRLQDQGWLLNELLKIGVVQTEHLCEINHLRGKLLAVFYKNFPHLAPDVLPDMSTPTYDPRAATQSPTGVADIFAGGVSSQASSRCASPTMMPGVVTPPNVAGSPVCFSAAAAATCSNAAAAARDDGAATFGGGLAH